MVGADTLSRRQFLAGCGGALAAAVAPVTAASPAPPSLRGTSPDPEIASLGNGGRISSEGRREIAAFDRRFAQQRGGPTNTVRAVEDLGLEPGTTIDGQFADAIEGLPPGTRVVFPGDATFRATGQLVARPERIDLIGNGCTFVLDSSTEHRLLNLDDFVSGSLLKGFNFESTGNTAFGIRVATSGTVKVKNINIKGYMRSDQSNPNRVSATFAPVAYTSSAAVRATNVTAIGGGAAGTHDKPDKPESATVNQIATPMGVWVGQSNQGTVQLVKCQFRGWSNGLYGGRTPGVVGVYGGEWYNNFNAQLRLGGGSVIDGVTLVLDARKWSMEENPGPFSLGEKQGVYAIRVDPDTEGNQSDPLRVKNTEIQALSMQEGASVIDFEPDAGPGILTNCKIINHLDRPIIYGASPMSSVPRGNVMVEHCLVGGNSPRPVMEMHDRPQSRIRQSCVTIPDAGPEDIQGAQIGPGVDFGQCTGNSGLSAPSEVGSPGEISSLPAPSYNGSTGAVSRPTPSKKAVGAGAGGMFAAIFGGIIGGLGMLFMMIFVIPAALLLLSLWQILGD